MAKELAKKEEITKALSSVNIETAWGAEEVEASDIRIAKILLMQSISQMVMDGVTDPGDLVNSVTQKVLGNCKTNKKAESVIEIVPIYMFKTWVVTEELNGKMEYKETLAYNPSNSQLQREEVVNGVKMNNNLTYNVLCMIKSDLADSTAFPYMMSLNRMSSNTGKDIFSFAQKAQMAGKPVCIYTIKLGGELSKNDKGSFYTWKVRGVSETQDIEKYVDTLKSWYNTFKLGNAKVDDSDLKENTDIPKNEYKGEF